MDKQNWGIELFANGMTKEDAYKLNEKIKELLYEQKVPSWSMCTNFDIEIPKSLHDKNHKPEES